MYYIEHHLRNYLFSQLNCAERISYHVGHHYEANVISFTAYRSLYIVVTVYNIRNEILEKLHFRQTFIQF